MPAASANLVEIFSSVQGEGPHVGASTLFVRFGACDLRCGWCDSPGTWEPARACRVEEGRGSGLFAERPNPVTPEEAVAGARALGVEAHRFVSLTGGEPLLQPEAVAALAGALRALGPRILLETHGAAPDALERVLDAVDVVSMDWKLASDVRRRDDPRGARAADFHDVHERFLRVALGASEVYVKLVVTPASEDAELEQAWERIASVSDAVTLVLQPVTPFGRVREAPSPQRMLALCTRASRILSDVRVIPQTHRLTGVL